MICAECGCAGCGCAGCACEVSLFAESGGGCNVSFFAAGGADWPASVFVGDSANCDIFAIPFDAPLVDTSPTEACCVRAPTAPGLASLGLSDGRDKACFNR